MENYPKVRQYLMHTLKGLTIVTNLNSFDHGSYLMMMRRVRISRVHRPVILSKDVGVHLENYGNTYTFRDTYLVILLLFDGVVCHGALTPLKEHARNSISDCLISVASVRPKAPCITLETIVDPSTRATKRAMHRTVSVLSCSLPRFPVRYWRRALQLRTFVLSRF